MTDTYDHWWLEGNNGDQEMEDDHQDAWQNIISLLDPQDILAKRILDFGCNQGGFLRKLHDALPFTDGVGIDLAKKAVEVANTRVGEKPIRYINTGDAVSIGQKFDTVISTSVLYLIRDLDEHFQMIHDVLSDGGVYYASFADQTDNPSFDYMKSVIDQFGATKMQGKTLNEVVDSLIVHGFSVELIKEYNQPSYEVTDYKKFYLSVADFIQSCESSYLIKATKTPVKGNAK
ncbi:class I SAM-dependent methyltransferase [Enterococcus sp. DIV0876]|uniref:class I SAM-dependent methyltransferase n=1 Tax=Enterococcus sp. DIV0876 TaxID=2774633 RepID=UPI003D2FB73E